MNVLVYVILYACYSTCNHGADSTASACWQAQDALESEKQAHAAALEFERSERQRQQDFFGKALQEAEADARSAASQVHASLPVCRLVACLSFHLRLCVCACVLVVVTLSKAEAHACPLAHSRFVYPRIIQPCVCACVLPRQCSPYARGKHSFVLVQLCFTCCTRAQK